MIQKIFTKITILLYVAIFISARSALAQDVTKYYLLPDMAVLPIGNKVDLQIVWENKDYQGHEGSNAITKGSLPVWTINGQPPTVANRDEGSIFSGLSETDGVYTAPDKVPPINPVTIAVKFRANDSTTQEVTLLCKVAILDPGKNWYFSYTYTKSTSDKTKSQNEEFSKQTNLAANSSMIIDAAPPYEGSVLINTSEGDSIVAYAAGGSYSEDIKDVSYEANRSIAEKTVRHYTGQPSKRRSGLEFQYDPTEGGGIQGAGLTFDITGTDKFWKPGNDFPGQLKETTNPVDDKNARDIILGHSKDVVKKIKDGFTIDYNQTRDTTYTDFKGMHTIKTMEQYHAQLIRVNKK